MEYLSKVKDEGKNLDEKPDRFVMREMPFVSFYNIFYLLNRT